MILKFLEIEQEKKMDNKINLSFSDAGTSEDTPADDSGSQADTDVTVKVESEQTPIRSESPKETETK